MPIELPEDDDFSVDEQRLLHTHENLSRWSNSAHRLSNVLMYGARIYNMPMIVFYILAFLIYLLINFLAFKFNTSAKQSFLTYVHLNIILFGISDTLAQSIGFFNRNSPRISFSFARTYNFVATPMARSVGTRERSSIEDFVRNLYDEDDEEGMIRAVDIAGELDDDVDGLYIKRFDFRRFFGFIGWGILVTFIQSWWYRFLNIYSSDPKVITVLEKVLSDQLVFSPVSLFGFFCYSTIVLEGKTFEDAKIKLQKIYLRTLLINFTLWVPVQFCNFLLVQVDFQTILPNVCSVFWNCFLSFRNATT